MQPGTSRRAGEGDPPSPAFRRASLGRLLLRLLRVAATTAGIGYLALLGLLYFRQAHLIFPGWRTQGSPEAQFEPPPGTERLLLSTSDGARVAALYGPALSAGGHTLPASPDRLSLLYFYGNGTCLAQAVGRFQQLRRLGANVLAVEYLGYGLSSGTRGEPGCEAAAEAGLAYLLSRPDVNPRRIAAAGTSLGGAVAIGLASRHPLAGVAAVSTFTSMAEMAGAQYPYVPVALLLRHRFPNERRLAAIRCPVFLAHGSADTLVPPAMLPRLAAAAGGPVTAVEVPGAEHNSVWDVGGEAFLAKLKTFLDSLPPTPAPAGDRS